MKVTDKMIWAYAGDPEITATDAHVIEQGLERVLKMIEPNAEHQALENAAFSAAKRYYAESNGDGELDAQIVLIEAFDALHAWETTH